MPNDVRLIGISIAGFQVFDELTEIPFRPVTLLYGPNSAGKSAVEDALAVLRDVWCRDDNENDLDPDKRRQFLKRHWRQIDERGAAVSPTVVLNAKIVIPIQKLLINMEHYTAPNDHPYVPDSTDTRGELELRLTYIPGTMWMPIPDVDVEVSVRRNLEVVLDGQLLISFQDGVSCSVALNHPSLPHWKAPVLERSEIPTRLGKNLRTRVGDINWTIRGHGPRLTREHYFDLDSARDGTTRGGKEGMTFLMAFKRVFDSVQCACRLAAREAFRLQVVPASRKVPSRTDLLHFFMGPTQVIHWNEPISFMVPVAPDYDTTVADLQESFGIRELGDPLYRELAKSMGFTLLMAKYGAGLERQEGNSEFDLERERRFRGIGEQVNRMLTDHLFRERGYRLAAEYRFLLSQKQLDEITDGAELDEYAITYYPVLVRLFLVDARGRRFNFDQVGSGLGYVLPVLAALFSARNGVLVQQPELHLHPALQADLGDVFIEAKHGDSYPIIVETHSEHLLLRILKRIRQTHQQWPLDAALQVRSDELSVLYFEPSPSGVTRVKELRVSQDGEFMDRWPRGFFAERDQELFDE
jgi:hypothetical protein